MMFQMRIHLDNKDGLNKMLPYLEDCFLWMLGFQLVISMRSWFAFRWDQ